MTCPATFNIAIVKMIKLTKHFGIILGIMFAGAVAFGQPPGAPQVRLLLSEVEPGSMSADQYCTLVFTDHRYHSEKVSRHHGKETVRKTYEGELPESSWSSLNAILDSKGFRDLNPPQSVPPLVMQDTHPYTISVARDGSYQNLEFLDSKSLKPYDAQLKPLLQWWKALRGQRAPQSNAPANPSCSLDSGRGIFSQ
jgi:hypothetical protein